MLLTALWPHLAAGVVRLLRRRRGELVLLAALQVSLPFWLMAAVIEYVPAGTAAVMGTLSPLLVALAAPLVDHSERLRPRQWAGVAGSVMGVGMASGITLADPGRPVGLAAQIGASATFAAATLLIKKRFADEAPIDLSTATLLLGGIALVPGAAASWPEHGPSLAAIAAMAELIVVGTVVAYVVFFGAIQHRGAGFALRPIYLSPGIAIAVGAVLFGDPITTGLVVGFALTIVGVATTMSGAWTVSNRRPGHRRSHEGHGDEFVHRPVGDGRGPDENRAMALNRDLEPALPARERPATTWGLEESCVVAAGYYNALYTSIMTSMIRQFGHARTYEVHQKLLRHHQLHYFLDGVKKLRLDEERSDAVRCAKYHCYSNALGGLPTRFAPESDKKCWLFYYPQPSGNPWPGPGLAIHTQDNMLVDYWGWHSNNGILLGNEGLIYVATHFVANDDPFDGGYFLDTGVPVPPEERVRISMREELPPDDAFQRMRLDPREWPEARVAKALRRYAVTWAADRAWSSLHHIGAEGAAAVTHGICVTTFQWLPRLLAAYGTQEGDGLDEFVRVAAGVHRLCGTDVSCDRSGDAVALTFDRGLFDYVAIDLTPDDQRLADAALAEAWSSIARHFDRSLDVAVAPGAREWSVTRSRRSA